MADSEHLNFRSVNRGAWISPEPRRYAETGARMALFLGKGRNTLSRALLTDQNCKAGRQGRLRLLMVVLYAADNFLHPHPPTTGLYSHM